MFKQIYFWQSRILLALSLQTMTFLSFHCAVFSITLSHVNAWWHHVHASGKCERFELYRYTQAIERINTLNVQVRRKIGSQMLKRQERKNSHKRCVDIIILISCSVYTIYNVLCVCFAKYNIIKLRICVFQSECCCSRVKSIGNSRAKTHKSSQIYTAKCSQYTKQEEVKRGYGADVTLRDIKRRSIISSRRNIPPKKASICKSKSLFFFRCICSFVRSFAPLSFAYFYFVRYIVLRTYVYNFFFIVVSAVQHFSDQHDRHARWSRREHRTENKNQI